MSDRFNWPDLMRAGLQVLRLAPDTFWGLTPAELRLMLGPTIASGGLDRRGLDRLLSRFPDTPRGENDV